MINVIKASAGSGKTYQLTYEYIKLLLGVKRKGHYELAHESDRERHRHILAVTFTNKATGEMKERIIKELSILAGKIPGKKSPYLTDLCRDFGNVNPEDVEKASYRALVELLFDYTNFNVSTIDSFFQMILRTFAKELKMSYNYDIELDDDYAIKVGVNDFLSSLAHDNEGTMNSVEAHRIRRAKSWIREFIKTEVINKKSWNIFMDSDSVSSSKSKNNFSYSFSFKDFAQSLTKEELRFRIDDIVDYLGYDESETSSIDKIASFKSGLYSLIIAMKKEALKCGENIIQIYTNEGFELEQLNSKGGLQWILKVDKERENYKLGTMETKKILETKDRSGSWLKKGKAKNAPVLSDNAICRICNEIDKFAECNSKYLIYMELHRNVFMLGLLGEISRYLSKYRKENDLILLADTNELLRKIINNEDMPFVYERVGIWLNHFLIDEFQDTSRAQWENMKPLLYNSCAEGNDNLIIGDEKQCIYRFRNADPTLLRTEVERHFTVKQNDSGKCINWRSAPNVVKFNNDFFAKIATMQGCAEEYSNVQQDLPNKSYDNEGYVEVNFVEKTKDSESDFEKIVLEKLPSIIKEIVSRGYKYSDIAVLTLSNDDGAKVIQSILDYNKGLEENEEVINVISNESLMLKSSSAVRLIISHLRYLNTKMIEISDEKHEGHSVISDMEGYVHRLLRNYESLMFKQGMEPGEALAESFATVERSAPSTELSLEALLPENTESFNIVSITEQIIHIITNNIPEKDLENENAFIQAFQDCVIDFSNRQNASIYEFIRWWDKGGCNTSVNSPDGQDAINVLTIHKSKGLEYKCVILPLCKWDLMGKEEVLWIPKEQMIASGLLPNMEHDIVPPLIPLQHKIDMDLEGNGLGTFYKEKVKERIIDSLNKTYVGFTRAVDELYIYTPLEGKESATKMSSLLSILPSENNVYVLGTKGSMARDEKESVNVSQMPLYKVESNKLGYTAPDLFFNERQKRGVRLHKIFQRICYKDDVDTALRYFKVKGLIPLDSYEEDCKVVKDALEDGRVQEWFKRGNRVYNERSMAQMFNKSRPDRFIITPDGRTIVIDYKFGEVHSATYHKQVKEYMNTLAEIGLRNLEGYIWYPLEGIIESVK